MNTKTLVMATAIIAATASLALAPTLVTTAMADRGGVNPGQVTETTCIHNGNLREVPCEDVSGQSADEITVEICKFRGKPILCEDLP